MLKNLFHGIVVVAFGFGMAKGVQAQPDGGYRGGYAGGYGEFSDAYKLDPSKLSPPDQQLFYEGPVSTGRYVAGGLVGTFIGFGIGHGIVGEYSNIGWAFTVGEIAGFVLLASAARNTVESVYYNDGTYSPAVSSRNNGLFTLGALLLTGFRIWEIIDIWVRPQQHNNDYRMLYWRLKNSSGKKQDSEDSAKIMPFIDGKGRSSLGLVYRF